jgi:hypothetical protein
MVGKRDRSFVVFRMVGDVDDYGGELGRRIAYIECGSTGPLARALDQNPAVPMG